MVLGAPTSCSHATGGVPRNDPKTESNPREGSLSPAPPETPLYTRALQLGWQKGRVGAGGQPQVRGCPLPPASSQSMAERALGRTQGSAERHPGRTSPAWGQTPSPVRWQQCSATLTRGSASSGLNCILCRMGTGTADDWHHCVRIHQQVLQKASEG